MSKNLLFVDDDSVFSGPVCQFLNSLKIDYDYTDDPRIATQLYREKHHDLVLCDYEMPIAKGTDVINLIKSEMAIHGLSSNIYLITGVELVSAKFQKDTSSDIEIISKIKFTPDFAKDLLSKEGFIT